MVILASTAVILMEGGTVYDLQVLDENKKEDTKSSGTFYWCKELALILLTQIFVKMRLNQR